MDKWLGLLFIVLVIYNMIYDSRMVGKLSNLLQKMKKEEIVDVRGSAVHAEWFLVELI